MDSERARQVLNLLGEALELPTADRLEFVQRACGDDGVLLDEVEALLARAEALPDDFLSTPPELEPDLEPAAEPEPGATVVDDTTEDVTGAEDRVGTEPRQHPERIGPFRILEPLGEGGMGVVYLAEQSEPVKRQVALKLVHTSLRSEMALARFNAERQAMARLSHPNVAQLHEAGTTEDGFPYFAMEHVPGDTLTDHCDRERLTVEQRLRMFISICRGVQHAHQKGILHRDLKPANLLVAESEGRPVPKIIDFGIAKALDEPLTEGAELTGMRAIGTPAYMSPEALAGGGDADTRSDVYSLGVVLYELLVGVRPHQAGGGAVVDQVEVSAIRPEAPRPSTRISSLDAATASQVAKRRGLDPAELAKRVRWDLDWIVMKAIADEPDRRYDSAAELAADILRHLRHEPVTATPPSLRYRAGKFVRRNRAAVAATVLVAVALILGIVGTSVGLVQARRQAERADREAEAARQVSSFMTDLFEVSDPGEARGNEVTARELLDKGAERISSELADQPLLRARMMRSIGDVYGKLGLYQQASPLLEEAVALQEIGARESPDKAALAASWQSLANLYHNQGRYEQAEKLGQSALELQEAMLGPDHPAVAVSLISLAKVYFMQGRFEEAEERSKRALKIREEALGPDHPEVGSSLNTLGMIHLKTGRFEDAEQVLGRALAIRETALGGDHVSVAKTLGNLAGIAARQGRWEDAEDRFGRALAIYEKVLEPDHPSIAAALSNLSNIALGQGRLDEAVEGYTRAVAIYEKVLEPDHPHLGNTLNNLGFALYQQGRYQEAEERLNRALAIYEKVLGPDHPECAHTVDNLATLYWERGRMEEADELYRRALAIREKALGTDHILVVETLHKLGSLNQELGRYGEAEHSFNRVLKVGEKGLGADHPMVEQARGDLAKLYRELGRIDDAEGLEARYAEEPRE
jgi:serine/threonine protein kinase/tetratricopeptide (TPR) repeat protein